MDTDSLQKATEQTKVKHRKRRDTNFTNGHELKEYFNRRERTEHSAANRNQIPQNTQNTQKIRQNHGWTELSNHGFFTEGNGANEGKAQKETRHEFHEWTRTKGIF